MIHRSLLSKRQGALYWDDPGRKRILVWGLILMHVLTFASVFSDPSYGRSKSFESSDAARYVEIAVDAKHHTGSFEYPPGAVILMRAIAGHGIAPTLRWLALLNAIADVVIAIVVARTWSRSAAIWYGVLVAPMLGFLVNQYDLIVAGIAVCGYALMHRRRVLPGAVLLTVAAMGKLWPVVFLLVLWAMAKRRAAISFAACLAAALVGWVASDGVRGVTDVIAYRGARGWHVESVPGAILAALTGATSRYESGSWRVGAPPKIMSFVLLVATIAVMAFAARLAARLAVRSAGRRTASGAGAIVDAHADDAEHLLAVAVVSILMAGATLLSPQYIIWIVPLLAIALGHANLRAAWRRRIAFAAIALVATNTFYIAANNLAAPDVLATRVSALVRNGCLVWLIVEVVRALKSLRTLEVAHAATRSDDVVPAISPAFT